MRRRTFIKTGLLMALPIQAQSLRRRAMLAAIPASGGGGTTGTPWITSFSAGSTRNDAFKAGCSVTVGAANVVVTQIGRWVISGNSHTHTLRIYNDSCVEVASATVDTSGATAGAFVYANISATLTAGQTYFLLSDEGNGDDWLNNGAGQIVSTTNALVNNGSVYNDGSCHYNSAGADVTYVGVDIKYSSP